MTFRALREGWALLLLAAAVQQVIWLLQADGRIWILIVGLIPLATAYLVHRHFLAGEPLRWPFARLRAWNFAAFVVAGTAILSAILLGIDVLERVMAAHDLNGGRFLPGVILTLVWAAVSGCAVLGLFGGLLPAAAGARVRLASVPRAIGPVLNGLLLGSLPLALVALAGLQGLYSLGAFITLRVGEPRYDLVLAVLGVPGAMLLAVVMVMTSAVLCRAYRG